MDNLIALLERARDEFKITEKIMKAVGP